MTQHATFIDNDTSAANRVTASWLNAINVAAYTAIGDGTDAPTTNEGVTTNIKVTQTGTGATQRSVKSKLNDFLNAADYGFLTTATPAANKTALAAAIAALGTGGGEIYIPAGSYSCDAGITISEENITIRGAGSGMAYEASSAGTKITFTGTGGVVGFDLTNITSAGNYTLLTDMSISGNNLCQYPIKVNGLALLEHLNVTGSTAAGAGIWLNDFVNSTKLSHVSAVSNNGIGILIGGSNGNSTALALDHVACRTNGTVGLYIKNAVHASFKDMVLESNTQEGLKIERVLGSSLNNLRFEGYIHVENNYAGTSNYNIVIDSYDPTDPSHRAQYIVFEDLMVSCSGTTKALNLIAGQYITFNNWQSGGADAITLATNAAYVEFKNKNGGTISDSGNRNFTLVYKNDGAGGLECSKALVQPYPAANYVWNAWNPSDVAGTLTNGASTGTATVQSLHFSVGNSSGTVTITFASAGRYLISFGIGCTNAAAYTLGLTNMVLGGTCTRHAARSTYVNSGDTASDQDYFFTNTIMITATANQTLTLLPKGAVTSGGVAGNFTFGAEVTAVFLGT